MKTIQQAALSALEVQNACNLTGVLHSYSNAMKIVREESHRLGKGTDWINNHPISRLYADKVASLSGTQNWDTAEANEAYADVESLAEEPKGMSAGDFVNSLLGGSTNIV